MAASFVCDNSQYHALDFSDPTRIYFSEGRNGVTKNKNAVAFNSACVGSPYGTVKKFRTYPPYSTLSSRGITLSMDSSFPSNDYSIRWHMDDRDGIDLNTEYPDNFAISFTLEDASGNVYDEFREIYKL